MENKTPPARCFRFGALPIGARFHIGKARGMGARSHVLNWHEYEKETAKVARCVESHGDRYQTGNTFTPNRLDRVFPITSTPSGAQT